MEPDGAMMLSRLIYFSRVAEDLDFRGFHNIVEQAKHNNQKRLLTGCLIQSDGYFVQYLEGGRSAISELLGRLMQDQRHNGLVVVHMDQIRERLFRQWRMAPVFSDMFLEVRDLYRVGGTFDPYALAADSFVAMFHAMQRLMYKHKLDESEYDFA